MYIAGQPVTTEETHSVRTKHDDSPLAEICLAQREHVEQAIVSAESAKKAMRDLSLHARKRILIDIASRIEGGADELAKMIAQEVGKTIKDCEGEVARAVETFRLAADECSRLTGDFGRADASPRAEGCYSISMRVPVGVCSFIVPFNFPLNLAGHKIAPAIAAGCPFVLKPDSNACLSVLALGEILCETDLPPEAWSIFCIEGDGRELLSEDERIALLSFTGSPAVGWALKKAAGRKKAVLELGGNAPCIVHEDADVDRAVDRIMVGGFGACGQSCISVQRIYAHESVYGRVRDGLRARIGALRCGDPLSSSTDVGPLFHADACDRIARWVEQAVAGAANVLVGGVARRPFFDPTLIENVPHDATLSTCEVFGPLVMLNSYTDFDEVLRLANDSDFGLQAGVFTADLGRALRAMEELEFGGISINDVPTMRLDGQPYGGVKQSGIGREGPRYAIEDMTEIRHVLVHP
jgi:acyl-CoA reductase-like NAD-dependent aldehyde dehydrogenase